MVGNTPDSLKKKILLCLSSQNWGGGEKHVHDIISYLGDSFDFQLIIRGPGELYEAFLPLKIPIHFYPLSNRFTLRESQQYLNLLKKERYDLIHCHLNGASFQFSLLRPWLPCPLLSTVHGFSTPLFYLTPHHLIAVSDAIYNSFFPMQKKKATRIYNGVSTPENFSQNRKKDRIQAFVFATIHPNKGQEFLIKALHRKNFKSHITLIGDGNPQYVNRVIRELEKHPEKKQIQFIRNRMKLNRFWEKADFVIIPSYREALSYVALESLSRGIPVLAASTGGLTEIINDDNINKDGLLFTPGNKNDFTQQLQKMEACLPEMQNHLLQNPFLLRRPEFLTETMIKKLKELYDYFFNGTINF
jgi:glycosyltransferase involved in cell wall biosynthesis